MKRRNKDGISGLLMAAIILVVVIIAAVVIVGLAKRSRTITNDTASQAFEIIGEASNAIKNEFDNNSVMGSDVISAINKYSSATLTVTVCTKANAAGKAYNGPAAVGGTAYTDPGVSAADHINESAMFKSTVSTNANGEVDSIKFVQQ